MGGNIVFIFVIRGMSEEYQTCFLQLLYIDFFMLLLGSEDQLFVKL